MHQEMMKILNPCTENDVMTEQEIRENAPSGATHYSITKIYGDVVYLYKDRRVINFCDGYRTYEPLGFIKPL